MNHVAIMKKSWGLTEKVLTGEKTVETRWYKARYSPWDRVHEGDTIYFRDTGDPVTVKATVSGVEQYADLDERKTREILRKYGHRDLGTTEIKEEAMNYIRGKRYCIIVHLKNPQKIPPFEIDKTGFGAMSAWIAVEDINSIKASLPRK
jgi:predicted transcriptional regulator